MLFRFYTMEPNKKYPNKLGLVLEGGGMRGLFTVALRKRLRCHGLRRTIRRFRPSLESYLKEF